MQKKSHLEIKNTLFSLAIPIAIFVLMEIICILLEERHLIASSLDFKNYIRNTGIAVCTALAFSFNLTSGRFDLSLGAQRMVATIIGANIAIKLGFGSLGVILCALACGLLAGAIVGFIFIITRVPPMVLGVGMALIYEFIAFAGSNAEGLQLFGKGLDDLADISTTILVVAIATLFIMILLRYTSFGYHLRAIQGSQQIAKNSGINIFAHALGCYTLAGGMVSFSGVFDAAFKGAMSAEVGLVSSASVMSGTFPMFLGNYMARWSNPAVGILLATMSIKLITTGFSVMKLSGTAIELINMSIFLAFLIFRGNDTILADFRARKSRIAQARQRRNEIGALI